MSLSTRAASSLVAKLDESRNISRQKGILKSKGGAVQSISSKVEMSQELVIPVPPLRRSLSTRDEEKEQVLNLDVPVYDKNRQFTGLMKLKMDRKDRHVKAVNNFSVVLDSIAEELEKELLQLSLKMREHLENLDSKLVVRHKTIEDGSFLIDLNEKELFGIRKEVMGSVNQRSSTIEKFASDLDSLEKKRADKTGSELKRLVDSLIGIAHQLPNDIEHIVENETFDLNNILTANRQSHSHLLQMLRKVQVTMEVETIQKWENGRLQWRGLRHEKALQDFRTHITGFDFTDPVDRKSFLQKVREGQSERHTKREAELQKLSCLTCEDIVSTSVRAIKDNFSSISEFEMAAIQECHDGLSNLRAKLRITAQNRVEQLRHELHEYGYLETEPDLTEIVKTLQSAIDDSTLTELWRVGGGLKYEFQSLSADLINPNIVYERTISNVEDRMALISSSFCLKNVLEEKGRLPQFERVRNLIIKLRNIPRIEVPNVVRVLIPMLGEIVEVENAPPLLKKGVHECMTEMMAEIQNFDLNLYLARTAAASVRTDNVPNTTNGGTDLFRPQKTRGSSSKGNTITIRNKTKNISDTDSTNNNNNSNSTNNSDNVDMTFDPILVRTWTRRLGVIYFGGDLPIIIQEKCLQAMEDLKLKKKCNIKVDEIVKINSEKILNRLDSRNQKLNEFIITFLEAQENYYNFCVGNLTDFFLELSVLVESHRTLQLALDERSADDLWDISEEYRLDGEDKEILFIRFCDDLRKSAGTEELKTNFQYVLDLLLKVEEDYRSSHGKSCFAADKYPLYLIDDFKRFLVNVSGIFKMSPHAEHPILLAYDQIYDETIRLNKKYFDENPNAGGVEIREEKEMPVKITEMLIVASEKEKKNGKRNSALSDEISNKTVKVSNSIRPPPIVETKSVIDETVIFYDSPNIVKKKETKVVKRRASISFSNNLKSQKSNSEKVSEKSDENYNETPYAGRYEIKNTLIEIAEFLTKENLVKESVPILSEEPGLLTVLEIPVVMTPVQSLATPKDKKKNEKVEILPPVKINDTHEQYCWLLKETASLPLSTIQANNLKENSDAEDWEEYCQNIAKFFVVPESYEMAAMILAVEEEIKEEEIAFQKSQKNEKSGKNTNSANSVNPETTDIEVEKNKKRSARDNMELFAHCEEISKQLKSRNILESDPGYIRANVPTCIRTNKPLVLNLELSPSSIEKLLSKIRDDIFKNTEITAYARIENSKALAISRKQDLTEILETKLRNHWPRRGRVETEIKQPREAELQSHEEKTWRHIRVIQAKMTETQQKFMQGVSVSEKLSESFTKDLLNLQSQLKSQIFKNLASLQVYDLNARRLALDFQAACAIKINILTKLCDDDVALIIAFANDFRKICPSQIAGTEGGYSDAELSEIEGLVQGQIDEINSIASEWRNEIKSLQKKQEKDLKDLDIFVIEYENVMLDLLMSEGLGPRYGAPRRRAQERIRSAVTKDDQSGGKIDEYLAHLEFVCAEEFSRKSDEVSFSRINNLDVDITEIGKKHFEQLNLTWSYLTGIKSAIKEKIKFLKIAEPTFQNTDSVLIWLEKNRFTDKPIITETVEIPIGNVLTLQDTFDEIDIACRIETKELYAMEGKTSVLTGTSSGVPESLKFWLKDAEIKIFATKGHREKSWKRTWNQIIRLENILAKKIETESENTKDETNENDLENSTDEIININSLSNNPTSDQIIKNKLEIGPKSPGVNNSFISLGVIIQLGAPSACVRLLTDSLLSSLINDIEEKESKFNEMVSVWELGRGKHERLLRPRLGSPDCADELFQLDSTEKERSQDLILNLKQYRTIALTSLFKRAKDFFEDITTIYKGLMAYLDSVNLSEGVQVPPDTAVAKKKMTLKRLRKAQRLREEVALGQGKTLTHTHRTWTGIILENFQKTAEKVEKIISVKNADPLAPISWITEIGEKSTVFGRITTSHRTLVNERDLQIIKYDRELCSAVDNVVRYCNTIIEEEGSWVARWNQQVEMLKKGSI